MYGLCNNLDMEKEQTAFWGGGTTLRDWIITLWEAHHCSNNSHLLVWHRCHYIGSGIPPLKHALTEEKSIQSFTTYEWLSHIWTSNKNQQHEPEGLYISSNCYSIPICWIPFSRSPICKDQDARAAIKCTLSQEWAPLDSMGLLSWHPRIAVSITASPTS